MAEDREDEQEGAREAPPKKSHMGLFLVMGILFMALAGAAAAYFLFFSGSSRQEQAKQPEHQEVRTVLVALDSFVLNLAEQGRFLKVTMQFEMADPANQQLMADKTPQLRDAIITLVSSKSAEALSSPEGKFQLKDELLLRANQAVGKDVFKNLYFTEFVMQ